MLFPVSAFNDHRSRLTLCWPLKGHCPLHLSQRDRFPLSMGASLTYSMYPSPESRPHLMKAQSKKRVLFLCAPLTDHSCLLSPQGFPSLEDNVQKDIHSFQGKLCPWADGLRKTITSECNFIFISQSLRCCSSSITSEFSSR